MTRIGLIRFLFSTGLVCFCWLVTAAEQSKKESINHPKLSFSWRSDILSNQIEGAETTAITILNTSHQVFQFRPRAKKLRGNLLLLADNRELPLQQNFMQPISQQLTRLGWKVFIPTIGYNDFEPKQISAENLQQGTPATKTSSLSSEKSDQSIDQADKAATTQPNHNSFFSSVEKYQNYYCQLINQTISATSLNGKPFVIMTHGNAGYWILSCLSNLPNAKYLAVVDPKISPSTPKPKESVFSQQTCPLYLFSTSQSKSVFAMAIEKQLWGGRKVRLNQGLVDNRILAPEDPRIARLITGWVESESKFR